MTYWLRIKVILNYKGLQAWKYFVDNTKEKLTLVWFHEHMVKFK